MLDLKFDKITFLNFVPGFIIIAVLSKYVFPDNILNVLLYVIYGYVVGFYLNIVLLHLNIPIYNLILEKIVKKGQAFDLNKISANPLAALEALVFWQTFYGNMGWAILISTIIAQLTNMGAGMEWVIVLVFIIAFCNFLLSFKFYKDFRDLKLSLESVNG